MTSSAGFDSRGKLLLAASPSLELSSDGSLLDARVDSIPELDSLSELHFSAT